ncbi:MAG: RNA polymerase subunit sigma-70 [Pyrinomonadaceae bacterium]|nr:RNA polymerase subunit sigma-70 [Phycisphaerales bacterium]
MEASSHDRTAGLNLNTGGQASSNSAASASLFDILYAELHRIAHRELSKEDHGHTLQTTALVHEAFAKLETTQHARWNNKSHFLAEAAIAMRRILVDHARAKLTDKRGGGWGRTELDENTPCFVTPGDPKILDLDHALTDLAVLDARQAQTVTLRYFGGCTKDETAAILGVSLGTVSNDWNAARAWLRMRLADLDTGRG